MSNFYKLINEKREQGVDVSMSQLKAVLELFKEVGVNFVEKKYNFTLEDFIDGMRVESEHGNHDKQTDVVPDVHGHDNPVVFGKISFAHLKESSKYYQELDKMEKKMPE